MELKRRIDRNFSCLQSCEDSSSLLAHFLMGIQLTLSQFKVSNHTIPQLSTIHGG